MIDKNEKVIQGMACYANGETEKWHQIQDAFLKEMDATVKDHCPCRAACTLHGNCKHCVMVHRGHALHLPVCLHNMVNERLAVLSELTENTLKLPEK